MKIFLRFLLLIIALFFFNQVSLAQTITPSSTTSTGLAQVCLKADRCDKTKDKEIDCSKLSAPFHKALLQPDPRYKIPANKTLYLVEVLSVGDGIFTTGIHTDKFPGGNEIPDLAAYGYKFEGITDLTGKVINTNPIQTDGNGDFTPVIWGDATTKGVNRQWLGFFETSDSGLGGSPQGALQQGEINFDFSESNCVKIGWDPYGRVFDSQTLEPVMGASVKLFKKTDSGSFVPASFVDAIAGQIINPQITKEDGGFNFIVVDGTYKLEVSGSGLTFPINNISEIHQNYSQAYYDIYPALTGEEIIQKGKIEHRDIPVKTSTLANNPPVLMQYFYERGSVTGLVSHPLTTINFYTKKIDNGSEVRYRLIGSVKADKMGRFDFHFDESSFDQKQNEFFGEIELIKTDLTQLTTSRIKKLFLNLFARFFPLANAQGLQSTTIKFQPIPSYIEGYAYDKNGKVISKAQVLVMINNILEPYYKTLANEKGYYRISSEFLPKQSYYLVYKTPTGSSIKTTTSDFIKQNDNYLAENKVDLNKPQNKQGELITIKKPSVTQSTSLKNQKDQQDKKIDNNQKTISTENKNNKLMFLILVILFLILLLAVVFVYFIKKKQTDQSNLTSL